MTNLRGFSLSKVLQKVDRAFTKHGGLISSAAGLVPGGAGIVSVAQSLVQGQGQPRTPGVTPAPAPTAGPTGAGNLSTGPMVLLAVVLFLALGGRRR